MISDKMSQLKQDLVEVKGKFEDVSIGIRIKENSIVTNGCKELQEAIEILEEHLKDHIENIEIFIGRIN